MDLDEARATLGVEPGTGWDDVRACYRRLVRAHHPDVDATAGATAATARITEAYAVLRRTRPDEPAGERPPSDLVARPSSDTLLIDAAPDEAFLRLLHAAHEIGEVTYVDPDVGLLETIVEVPGAPVCSLLVTLQWRGAGTEAFCTLEVLGTGRPPSLAAVVDVLTERLQAPTP